MAQPGAMTIDPAIMIGAAQTVDVQRSIIENCLNSIIQDANSLKSVWEGESANAYQEAITKIKQNSPKVMSVLKKYSNDLNKVAANFKTTDAGVGAESKALPSNVFGGE